MFSHAQLWRAIDLLAKQHGLSPSGLAKKAGLDSTTFNPSKRITKEKKLRWPSTESIAKVLEATGSNMDGFVELMQTGTISHAAGEGHVAPIARLRCVSTDHVGDDTLFDASGFPTSSATWDEMNAPSFEDRHAYMIEISGDDWLPVYRDGDYVIISPAASIRKNDRVLCKRKNGAVHLGMLRRRSAQRVELASFNGAHPPHTLDVSVIAWMARITWASQ